MRPYLNNFMSTLTRRRQERVGSLLAEARTGKEQLSTLMSRLESRSAPRSLVLNKHRSETLIRSQSVASNSRSINERIEELFDVSNTIAMLLNSHSAVLSSDVKAIEDELLIMEKMVNNFAFLLADNQAYDYAFLESFVDELNRDHELTAIPDRSALPFGSADNAQVHAEEGSLALSESLLNSHGMSVEVINTNAGAFTIEDTGVENLLKKGISTGWKRTMLTGGPINAPIEDGVGTEESQGRAGSQIVLEFRLAQSAPCSEIRIVPYANMLMQLLQVTTFTSEDDVHGTHEISEPTQLDRPLTLHFPMKPVYKFHVTINQPAYKRVTQHQDVIEYRYNQMIESINQRREAGGGNVYKRVFFVNSIEQAILLEAMGEGNQSISLPATNHDTNRGPMDEANLLLAFRFDRPSIWSGETDQNSFILFDVLQQTDSEVNDIRRYDGDFDLTRNTKMLATDNPISQVVNTAINTQVVESGFTYYYNMGLHYVGIGVESPGYKGVYVSKTLPAPGDIGVVRIKADEDNYYASQSARHSRQLTSVEYSVSNQSDPNNENDWKPILPVNTESVQGERLFINSAGRARFRFLASASQRMAVYRNGYLMSFGSIMEVIPGDQPDSAAGISVNLSAIADEDIFTCDYYTHTDQTTVSFEGDNYELPPLVFAFDNTGSGEQFMSTTDRNIVTLSSRPYVDPNLAAEGGYQPITIQLSDGTVAQNLTDYQNHSSVAMPTDGYYYIHSGSTIMFNQPITTPFRVYYQYLQNNVRFRVVLRCNVKDYVSPKVDYVHLKAKTRHPDVRSI